MSDTKDNGLDLDLEKRTISNGLDLEKEKRDVSETDWIFGATSFDSIAKIPEIEREKYLPRGEEQRGQQDYMSCATIAPVNYLETEFNWLYRNYKISPQNRKWLEDNGYISDNLEVEFSDRFPAILSGTTRQGNSLISPLQTIHSKGLIPKKLLPANKTMTFDQYHNKADITDKMLALGLEFTKRFPITYERVLEKDFGVAFVKYLVELCGFAWTKPNSQGIYPNPGNVAPNHVFLGIGNPKYKIYDSYLDRHIAGDFIKQLAPDYDLLDYGYRLIIAEEVPKDYFQFTKNLYVGIIDTEVTFLQRFLNKYPEYQVASTGKGSPGQETNYFGTFTKEALKKFQKAVGIIPVSGYFGSITRKYINEMLDYENNKDIKPVVVQGNIWQIIFESLMGYIK